MEKLYEIFDYKIRYVSLKFKRFLFEKIDWSNRMISIQGARGAGKTTLLLQYIKQEFGKPSNRVLYVDVNHLYFSQNSLIDLADEFYKQGGKYLFLDEIHKYQHWSNELKQIFDTYADLKIVFTGSSILEIQKGEADLSRRIVTYLLPILSFREFLELNSQIHFDSYSLDEILINHMEIAHTINLTIRPFEYFPMYLKSGQFPFFKENMDSYQEKLMNTINLILEVDLPAANNIDFINIQKLKKLLVIIAQSVPFKPNTQKLSELIGVSRNYLIRFFVLLEKAQLISTVQSATKGIRKMAKPEKIYLNNTNLISVLGGDLSNMGNMRETFFFNQMNFLHTVELPQKGDFIVDHKYLFEVGGSNKTQKQIAQLKSAYLVKDGIEMGAMNSIPLWLFGFLY
ncbi:MAG: AAA family ATPase [Bacteroidales bacterium]|jgi:predicted AAA+ superfamily ATPase|nr:AAA family ATPase [Bacteroidales bacterium]